MAPILLPLLLLSAPFPQETPLVQGAYRGPADEVLTEEARAREGVLFDGWERWEFWFEQEQGALWRGGASADERLLRDDERYGARPGALTRATVTGDAVPLLLRALRSPLPELRESAALALGRCGVETTAAALTGAADDPIAQVRQAALLGLGLLGNDSALVALGDRASDPGRSTGDRSFAILGLGLSRRPEARILLAQVLERDFRADRLLGEAEHLLQATVWAAGLHGSRDFVPMLLARTEELERTAATSSRRVRCLALWALGAIGDPSATGFLVKRLGHGDVAVQRAAAQALGRLGDPGALGGIAQRLAAGGDLQTRVYCLLAAGRIGGAGAAKLLEAQRESVRHHRQLHAAWGLAAGLAGAAGLMDGIYAELISGEDQDPWQQQGLGSLENPRRDEERLRGALALGFAFYGDGAVVSDFGTLLGRKGVGADFAGYLCAAAGYLGGSKAEDVLDRTAASALREADTRRGLATGYALIGDAEATGHAVDLLLDPDEAPSVRWAAARALGLAREEAALRRILDTLEEDLDSPALAARNAHALMAVGHLGDPWTADRLDAALEGWDHRQEFRLQRCLAAY